MTTEPVLTKPVTTTYRIELRFNTDNKEEIKEHYSTLNRWRKIVVKAANTIATHHYAQENISQMFYLTEGVRHKLVSAEKDELGILSTSKQNSTYQVLSKLFKGEIPTAILTALNSAIVSVYNKEKSAYFKGERSLRTYKQNLPIPIRAQNIINLRTEAQTYGEKTYQVEAFTLYNIPFKLWFGRDRYDSNRMAWARMRKGDYKLCDSSIQMKDNKLFLLAVFQFEKEKHVADPDVIAECYLDVDTPIIMKIGNKEFKIGERSEFLHNRISIQEQVRRTQRSLRFTKGGKGRQHKLQALERFHKAEKNYVATKLHYYSSKLIDIALKFNAGSIILKDQTSKEVKAKEDEFLLRNWSYFDLKLKIEYKANKVGKTVIVE